MRAKIVVHKWHDHELMARRFEFCTSAFMFEKELRKLRESLYIAIGACLLSLHNCAGFDSEFWYVLVI